MVSLSCSIMSNSLWPMGCSPTGCPWNFPGKNTGMSWQFLFHRIFSIHGLNLCLLLCWKSTQVDIFYYWATKEAPSTNHVQFSSVQVLSRVQLFVTPWTAARQFACPSPTPRAYSNSCPLCRWCHPTISSSVIPFSSHFQSFPASWSFPINHFFASAVRVLEFQVQHQSFQWIFRTDFLQDGLVWSPRSPRASQESSPTPQFKSINSSVLSFLYSPNLTSICNLWKP